MGKYDGLNAEYLEFKERRQQEIEEQEREKQRLADAERAAAEQQQREDQAFSRQTDYFKSNDARDNRRELIADAVEQGDEKKLDEYDNRLKELGVDPVEERQAAERILQSREDRRGREGENSQESTDNTPSNEGPEKERTEAQVARESRAANYELTEKEQERLRLYRDLNDGRDDDEGRGSG